MTEGSPAVGSIWQRSRYDWTAPGRVTLDVLDSNAFGPGSRWTYLVEPAAGGGTDIDLSIRRVPTTTKGKVVDVLLSLGGGIYFSRDLRRTVRRLESGSAPPT